MEFLTCYYSVVRYVPNLIREEAINIGVLLLCPSEKFVACRFPHNFSKLRSYDRNIDTKLLSSLAQELSRSFSEDRYRSFKKGSPFSHYYDKEYITYLSEQFGQHIRFTPPRTTLATSLEEELLDLYQQFVDEDKIVLQPAKERKPGLKSELRKLFTKINIIWKIEYSVAIRGKYTEFSIEYNYQNGRPHLIQPISFNIKPDEAIKKAIVWNYHFNQVKFDERFRDAAMYAVVEPAREEEINEKVVGILSESPVMLFDLRKDTDRFIETLLHAD